MGAHNDSTALQLQLIAEVAVALGETGVEWWLYGGWGVDFNVGRVTRDHDDIEIFIWVQDAGHVRLALERAGFAAPKPLHPLEGQPYLKQGQEVGVWYLLETSDGAEMQGRWTGWRLAADWFERPLQSLNGATARALAPAGLIELKLGFAAHAPNVALRAKDLADIALLRTLAEGSVRST